MNLDIRTKKTVEDGIVESMSISTLVRYVSYSPGNGTRYRLLIANVKGTGMDEIDSSKGGWVVTSLNSLKSMVVVDNGGLLHFNYVMEKLQCGIADAVCLAEIIGHCTNRPYVTSEACRASIVPIVCM